MYASSKDLLSANPVFCVFPFALAEVQSVPPAGCGGDADAARHTETHAGIVPGRCKYGVLDLHGGEQAVAGIRSGSTALMERHESAAIVQSLPD
jgi:hypothetical protein